MTPDRISLYVTAPDAEVAERMARCLVEERLVACVNVLPAGRSVYRWEGALQIEPEVVMFCKTSVALAPRATSRLVELHPSDVPCVVQLPILGGHAPYLAWLDESLQG